MDKKYYEAPSVEVVDLKLQGNLLAGSGGEDGSGEEQGYDEDMDAADIESAKKNNFNADWK